MDDRLKILLTEYQVAQQYADASGDRIWKLTGLLFVTSLGSIAIILQAGKSWIVFPIAFGSMGLIFWWAISVVRESFYQKATNRRMEAIENVLRSYEGMQASDTMLYGWVRYWAKFNSDKRTPADHEVRDHNYIWPPWARWLGCRRTWPWALIVSATSTVVILLGAISRYF